MSGLTETDDLNVGAYRNFRAYTMLVQGSVRA
jgi:hypothetical protein